MKQLPQINLQPIFHQKEHQIKISFKYNNLLIALLRDLPKAKWSKTLASWYIKNNPENLKLLFKIFNGQAQINADAIFNKSMPTQQHPKRRLRHLTAKNRTVLNNFYKYLKGKRYSLSTIDTYTQQIADFVEYNNDNVLENLNNKAVEHFIENIYIKRNYAISTQRQFISALKLFIVFYPYTYIDDIKLSRPKASKTLPNVLSQNEVIRLLRVTENLKHKTILALIYSAGLRISELINLKIEDLKIDRRQIHIKNAKGRKDRYVVLAESTLPLLENYLNIFKPSYYLIEGLKKQAYSASSIRKFMNTSCKKANLIGKVTPHTLRHSYATHLIETGVGLRHIQELLGHSSPKTTMIYTHIARKDILSIKSPLDNALEQISKSHKQEQKVSISFQNRI
ncbi:tyrosine-type recombinase/integrase [Olleya sp. R77988]|uniref:tyrosine-type recombinase/integrase n=1 Tax=Olleya sp. R77988 TaxID=3093875 RepID=UPI0037C9E202